MDHVAITDEHAAIGANIDRWGRITLRIALIELG